MKLVVMRVCILVTALMGLALFHEAFAQADPPDRVARLNFVEGSISYLPSGGDENDWVTANVNRPLTTGDRLWADAGSRGELHIGSTAVRIDHNTGISFLNLGDTVVQIRLSDGVTMLHVRQIDAGDTYEVDTPNLAFTIQRPGEYRIETDPDNNVTVVTVRQGLGEAIGGGRSWQVISDQEAVFSGTETLSYDLRTASQPPTDFEQWARNRDAHEDRVAATQYVSPEMTGYEDLDAYGSWNQVPEYGWCWYPRVAVGWAPYRFGHWVWIAPWGWTWVEDEPWGFAPFHYGRWAYYRTQWIWVPGPRVVRPVYTPALVAWVGGGGVSISVALGGGGGVGWFPLGPREVFVPGYHASERYVTNINITNTVVNRTTVVDVFNNRRAQSITYVNRNAPNGITVIDHDTFVNARPVARNIVAVPPREISTLPVARTVQLAPERTSVYGAGDHNAPRPPEPAISRPVVVKRTPPAAPNQFERPQNQHADRPPAQASRPAPAQAPARQAQPQQRGVVAPSRPNQGSEASRQREVQPLARPAPPVRPPTRTEKADTQAKQKAWENARKKNEEKPVKK